jgi:putative acetyltransferase
MNVCFEQPVGKGKIRNVHLKAFESDPEANLVDYLRKAGIETIPLVAEQNADLVGHILFRQVTIDGNIKIMGLAPMAVLPSWQRKGVGTKPTNAGLKASESAGYRAVVVLGHPDYYPRFGFVPSRKFGIKSEYDCPPEAFLVKEIFKGALAGITGIAQYHPAFDEL